MLVYWRVPTFTIQNYNQCWWIGHILSIWECLWSTFWRCWAAPQGNPVTTLFPPLKFNMVHLKISTREQEISFESFQVLCWTFGGVSFVVCFSFTDDWRLKHTDFHRFLLLTVYNWFSGKKKRRVCFLGQHGVRSFSGTSMLASMCSFHWRINRKFVKFSRWFQTTNVFSGGKYDPLWLVRICVKWVVLLPAPTSTNSNFLC